MHCRHIYLTRTTFSQHIYLTLSVLFFNSETFSKQNSVRLYISCFVYPFITQRYENIPCMPFITKFVHSTVVIKLQDACTQDRIQLGSSLSVKYKTLSEFDLVNKTNPVHNSFFLCLFIFSTCFGQLCAHHQVK
jgi:hypothetical protein